MTKKMKKSLVESRMAWAINTNYTDIDGKYYPGFIGVLYFNPDIPTYQDNRICLFRTRKDARIHFKKIYPSFPKAKIVKVRITINEVTNGD